MYDVPLTEAELAAADPLVAWDRGMPRPEPKRKLDTPAFSTAYVDAALENHKTLMLDVMLESLKAEVANLRKELEIEKRVSERVQVEQRHNQQRVNGHANGHA